MDEWVAKLRSASPLVLAVTNFVTVNDCANILLAAGASPVMTLDPADAEGLAESADAVLLNTGTPTRELCEAMLRAGHAANARKIPLVLDPVGAGACPRRRELLTELLSELRFSVIRGNASEMLYLAGEGVSGRGVDAGIVPDEEFLHSALKQLAEKYRCAVCASGAVDHLTDGSRIFRVRNGHPYMARISGTGCMSGALAAAFLATAPEEPLEALKFSVLAVNIAGELAAARMLPGEGSASCRIRLIDAVSLLSDQDIKDFAWYEEV